MTSTIEALQNLYVALGGEAADVTNITVIPDMINAIATLKESQAANETEESVESNGESEG